METQATTTESPTETFHLTTETTTDTTETTTDTTETILIISVPLKSLFLLLLCPPRSTLFHYGIASRLMQYKKAEQFMRI